MMTKSEKIGMRMGFDVIPPVEFCPFSRFVLPYYPCYSSFLILLHGVRSDGLRLAEEPAYFQRSRLSKPCCRAIRILRISLEIFGYLYTLWKLIDRYLQPSYSLTLFDHFCPVKRPGEYFAKEWSE